MSDYCKNCKTEVGRCWDSGSGCSGGGHCWDCGGYDFETDEEQEEREANEAIEKVLVTDAETTV